jgi:hypothetical protein
MESELTVAVAETAEVEIPADHPATLFAEACDHLSQALSEEGHAARHGDSVGLASASLRKSELLARLEVMAEAGFGDLPVSEALRAHVIGAQASLRVAVARNERDLRAAGDAVSLIMARLTDRLSAPAAGYGAARRPVSFGLDHSA